MRTLPTLLAACIASVLAGAACDRTPGSLPPEDKPAQDLAELPPFPAPNAEPPARELGPKTEKSRAPEAPVLPSIANVLIQRGATPDAPPAINVHFAAPAEASVGPAPLVALTPDVPFDAAWTSPRVLKLRLEKPLPPSTRVEVSVRHGDLKTSGAANYLPLRASASHYRSWSPDRRQLVEVDTLIELSFSEPLAVDDVRRHLEVSAGDERPGATDDSPLPTLASVPFELLVIDGDAMAPAKAPTKSLYVRPTERFQTGRVYAIRIDSALKGAGGLSLEGAAPRMVLTGPPVFNVASVECGWGDCKPGATWSVTFTRPLAEDGNTACISIDPPIDPKTIEVSGHSIYLHPEVTRTPQTFRLTANADCTSATGEPLGAARTFDLRVQSPAANLSLAGTVGVIAIPETDTPATLPTRVVGTHHVEVRELRIGTTAADLAAILPLDLSPWADTDMSHLAWGPTREVRTSNAMNNPRQLNIPLETVAGGAPGWALVSVAPRATAKPRTNDKLPEARTTLVQVTNLALTAKFGPNETTVWVSGLKDGLPVADATVALMGPDGTELWRGRTDATGIARAPVPVTRERGSDSDKSARFAIASLGDDRAFVDFNNWETRLSTWRFDLPIDWEEVTERPVGLVFTERGIYRPGDTVFIKGHVRTDRGEEHASLAGTDVTVAITNPVGEEVLRRDMTLGTFSDFDLTHATTPSSPTGTWHVQVTPRSDKARTSLYGTFRVEAFRAPTFFATISELAMRDGTVTADISGRYYFGAPMAGATMRWWLHRRPIDFQPPGFEGYTFGTPSWLDDWENRSDDSSRVLATDSGLLDDEGRLKLDVKIDLSGGQTAAGSDGTRTWLVELEAEATDADAQVSATRKSVRVDPADFYVGLKADRTFAAAGEGIKVEVVAASADGKRIGGRAITATLSRRTWVRTEEKNPAGQVSSRWEKKDEIVSTETLTTRDDGAVSLDVRSPKAGLHFVRIAASDDKGRPTTATTEIWLSGSDASWSQREDKTVPLVAAKTTWNPGETARFIVQSPWDRASALVTVETSRVLYKRHVILEGRAPVIELPVTDAMAPNAFVSVALVGVAVDGAVANPEAQFGYTRLNVATGGKELAATITPDAPRYEPGGKVKVTVDVRDQAGAPVGGEATFMAVDESVLALTGYATPDVHKALFIERALGVRTADTRALVLAQRTISDEEMKSDWGGGGESGQATRYRSEFATTAAFLPKVAIGADGKAELSFDLPDNLTTFRLMAVVASEDGRFGHTDTKVEVQKPLLVRPGLPRFVTAGDMVDISALVQAVAPEARGNVAVRASVTGPAALVGDEKLALTLTDAKTTRADFRLKALSAGTATVAFAVTHEGGEVSDAVEIQVPIAHPSAARHAITVGAVAGRSTGTHVKSFRLEVPTDADPTLGELTIDIQNSQLGQLMPALDYVLEYPYGCAEQTTSSTMPLVALRTMKAATTALRIDDSEIVKRIQTGVDRLLSMQTPAGGLSYWPGGDTVHPFATAWASIALIDASTIEGIRIPPGHLDRLLAYLSELGRDRVPLPDYWKSEIIAVRPFAAWALARAGQPEPANQTALFESRTTMPAFSRALLALAIHESKRPEGNAQIETLISEIKASVTEDAMHAVVKEQSRYAWRNTMSSDIRSTALLAMLLAKVAPQDPMLPKLRAGLIHEQRNGLWYNTQDNAFGLLALADGVTSDLAGGSPWVAEVHLGDEVVLETTMDGGAFSSGRVVLPMERLARANGKALSIVRQGGAGNLYYNMQLKHFPVKPADKAVDRGFTVEREYRYAEGPRRGELVADAKLGDLIEVTLSVSAGAESTYVAVEDPLPAGFEPVLLGSAVERTNPDLAPARANDDDDRYSWSPVVFNHTDQRDDRVLLFADQMPDGVHRHRYLVRATSAGTFVAPAPVAHEMYSPWVEGIGTPARVVVGDKG